MNNILLPACCFFLGLPLQCLFVGHRHSCCEQRDTIIDKVTIPPPILIPLFLFSTVISYHWGVRLLHHLSLFSVQGFIKIASIGLITVARRKLFPCWHDTKVTPYQKLPEQWQCFISILNTDENENERFRPLRSAFNYVFHAVPTGEVVSMLTKWQGINTRSLLHQSHRAVIKHSTEAMFLSLSMVLKKKRKSTSTKYWHRILHNI